jgi:hypothetical protein
MNNAIFVVAKDSAAQTEAERDRVLGIAMWVAPQPLARKEAWYEWWQSWVLWGRQLLVNFWFGRGGLNVKVSLRSRLEHHNQLFRDTTFGKMPNAPPRQRCGLTLKVTISVIL